MVKLSEVNAEARPFTASVWLCLRGDLVRELEQLERDLAAARRADEETNEPNKAPAIARRIRDIEAEMRNSETEFTFQAIGKSAWRDLLAEHPPSKEQKDLGFSHDPETFAVAAMARSLIDPYPGEGEEAEAEVQALVEKLTTLQLGKLWTTCMSANVDGGNAPGESLAASAVLRAFEPSSITAVPAASPEASSSVA
jgi:hypothetical protein